MASSIARAARRQYHRFRKFRPAITGKWLELLKDIAPSVNLISAILDQGTSYAEFGRAIANLAPSLHLKYAGLPVSSLADIEQAIKSSGREPGGGLIVMGTVAAAHRDAVFALPPSITYRRFIRLATTPISAAWYPMG